MKSKIYRYIINVIFVLLILVLIYATINTYLLKKDYTFVVEEQCDPTEQTCYERDCEIEDNCPPNGLSIYTIFEISASDYHKCVDNSCHEVCHDGTISCVELICGESDEDECFTEETLEE